MTICTNYATTAMFRHFLLKSSFTIIVWYVTTSIYVLCGWDSTVYELRNKFKKLTKITFQ
jgi:hypothetical protein